MILSAWLTQQLLMNSHKFWGHDHRTCEPIDERCEWGEQSPPHWGHQ